MIKHMNLPKGSGAVAVTSWDNILATNRKLHDLTGYPCVAGIDSAKKMCIRDRIWRTEYMKELKTCKFCGGEAKIFTPTISTYIMCKECKVSTNLYSQSEEAIEAWNRRCEHETD